jgi:hypothetical protein
MIRLPRNQTGQKSMSLTNVHSSPTELLSQSAETRSRGSAILEPEVTRWRPICEPQTSLWKVAARPISAARAMIELILLALFFLITLAVMANCLRELSHLLHSDPVGQVAQSS